MLKQTVLTLVALLINHIAYPQPGDFKFSIKGNVVNGDGIKIYLYIPSEGLDNRIVSEIKNGAYSFSGTAKSVENAQLRFEEDVDSDIFFTTDIFVEPGTSIIDFAIARDTAINKYSFKDVVVRQGNNNKFFFENSPAFWSAYGHRVSGNPRKNDSLQKFIYPKVREQALKTYEKLFFKTGFPEVSLYFLTMMLGNNNEGAFQTDQLNAAEKKKIKMLFDDFEKGMALSPNFRLLQSKVNNLESKPDIIFKDFDLVDSNGRKVQLSEIVKNNKYTVLDFWWSGCIPCREFNRETEAYYTQLRSEGIEIVGINSDTSLDRWTDSSQKDNIKWINLYGGRHSDIELYYDLQSYPTKIVFDREMKVVDIKFTTASELMNLLQ